MVCCGDCDKRSIRLKETVSFFLRLSVGGSSRIWSGCCELLWPLKDGRDEQCAKVMQTQAKQIKLANLLRNIMVGQASASCPPDGRKCGSKCGEDALKSR